MKECGRRGGKGEKDGQGKERKKETIGGRDDVEGGSERKEETMQDKEEREGWKRRRWRRRKWRSNHRRRRRCKRSSEREEKVEKGKWIGRR